MKEKFQAVGRIFSKNSTSANTSEQGEPPEAPVTTAAAPVESAREALDSIADVGCVLPRRFPNRYIKY